MQLDSAVVLPLLLGEDPAAQPEPRSIPFATVLQKDCHLDGNLQDVREFLANAEADGKTRLSSSELRPLFQDDRSMQSFANAYMSMCSKKEIDVIDNISLEGQIQTLQGQIKNMQKTQDEMLVLLRGRY